ncbi:hypothetical protein NDR87_31555 [Nocardia sp. CDC159]|uniref:Uncharacterized protein n=1 Tax=Nocardia pulmonis TaxID=2951408 RepID=A0A9X2EGS8_9NOCA|nr:MULTISPECIES: hypothetical protein [Nocardia]MCM6777913.1 hypothetical protein [Nocardia pulmonis]MCM6790916.1 hypothetical protein [Nocardia sp. CDC159]
MCDQYTPEQLAAARRVADAHAAVQDYLNHEPGQLDGPDWDAWNDGLQAADARRAEAEAAYAALFTSGRVPDTCLVLGH